MDRLGGAEYLVFVVIGIPIAVILFYNLFKKRQLEIQDDKIIIWNGKKQDQIILKDDIGEIKIFMNTLRPFYRITSIRIPSRRLFRNDRATLFFPLSFIKKDNTILKYKIQWRQIGWFIDALVAKGFARPKTYRFGKELPNIDWRDKESDSWSM